MSNAVVRPAIVLIVLAIVASATAQAPIVVPGSFSVLASVTGTATSGSQELFVLDGDVRLDSTPDDGEALSVLFVQDDAVLTGDFEVWECEIVGRETLDGRETTVWSYEVVRGREGRPAIVNDPLQTTWIDDELGVPLAYDAGPDLFVTELVSVDATVQDGALFTGR